MTSSSSRPLGERELIARFARRLGDATPVVRVGIGDDAAVLAGGDGELVVSCDSFVEGVHFRRAWGSWHDVGYKAAVTTVSDLAAMAVPVEWLLVALGLEAEEEDVGRLVEGLGAGIAEAASAHGFALAGGDVSTSDTTFLSLTAGGRAREAPILRSGAREGDRLVVTGALGRSAAALRILDGGVEGASSEDAARAVEAFLRPSAGFADAAWLRALGARALVDVSDGLGSEAGHLAEASGTGVVIEAARIPVDETARRILDAAGADARAAALASGEEYVLLAAVPPGADEVLDRACAAHGWTIAGRFGGAAGAWLEHPGGDREAIGDGGGWRHFG